MGKKKFGSEIFPGQHFMGEKIGSEICLCKKKLGWKFLDPKKIWVGIFIGLKEFGSEIL